MKSALDTALAEGHKNGARLAAILHDDNAIAKVEINHKNCFRAVKGYLSGGLNETEAAYRIDAELEWVRIHWISQQLPECK